MDLVNDLSNDLAVALFVEGAVERKLEGSDAKRLIARFEDALNAISEVPPTSDLVKSSDAHPLDIYH